MPFDVSSLRRSSAFSAIVIQKQATPAGLGSHVPGAGEVAHVFAATTRHRKGTSAMIERVVTGAVDVAIAARKEIDPEKWALVPTVASASNGEASNGSLPAVEDKEKDKGGVEGVADVPANGVTGGGTGVGGAGGGKAVPPASQVSGGVVGIGADKGGGSTVPTRKSSVGGVASGPKAPRSGTREDASKRKSSTGNKGGSEEMALASHAGFEGLTKKERKALEEQRASAIRTSESWFLGGVWHPACGMAQLVPRFAALIALYLTRDVIWLMK